MTQNPFSDQSGVYPRYDPQTGKPLYPGWAGREPEAFSPGDTVFGWLMLLAGYAYWRVFPVTSHPFGGFLLILALFIAAAAALRRRGAGFGLMPCLMAGTALLLSPALFLSANALFHFLVYSYGIAVWCYFVYASCGNALEGGFSSLLPMDFIKAILVQPFASFEKLVSALFGSRGRKQSRLVWKLLIGLLIAVVPAALILALLSYDREFVALFRRIFSFDWQSLFSHLGSLIFGIPVGMYFYGAYFSATRHKLADTFTAQSCRETSSALKKLPALSAVAAAVPVLVIYVVFFASQWQYYISAFSGVIPSSISVSAYARSGFFQLCAVSVINFLLIIAMQLFVSRRAGKTAPVTRVLSVVFSVVTLVLIATAMAKLYLYIERFGLTPKRVYAGWFMLILAVLFLLIILKQMIRRLRLIPVSVVVCVVLFAALSLSGSDRLIATYNIDRYLDGTLESVDVEAMEDLGDAAVPAMVRLAQTLDRRNGTDINAFLADPYDDDTLYTEVGWYLLGAAEREPHTLFNFTVPRLRAENALEQLSYFNGQ